MLVCVSSSSIKHMNRSRIEPVGGCELTDVNSGVNVKRVHAWLHGRKKKKKKEGVECFSSRFS